MKFTGRRLYFIENYIKYRNRTKAALEAGYSEKAARKTGSRLFTNKDIRAEIDKRISKIGEKIECSYEQWLHEVKSIAFAQMGRVATIESNSARFEDTEDWPEDELAAIESITQSDTETLNGGSHKIAVKMHSKVAALELLGKACGHVKEKVTHEIPEGTSINFICNGKVEKDEAPN